MFECVGWGWAAHAIGGVQWSEDQGLLPCGSWRCSLGHLAWWYVPLPAEPFPQHMSDSDDCHCLNTIPLIVTSICHNLTALASGSESLLWNSSESLRNIGSVTYVNIKVLPVHQQCPQHSQQ